MGISKIDKGINKATRIVELLRKLGTTVVAILVGLATFAKNWGNAEETQKGIKDCIKDAKELRDEMKRN